MQTGWQCLVEIVYNWLLFSYVVFIVTHLLYLVVNTLVIFHDYVLCAWL